MCGMTDDEAGGYRQRTAQSISVENVRVQNPGGKVTVNTYSYYAPVSLCRVLIWKRYDTRGCV